MLQQVQQHWLIYMIIMCLSDTGVIVAVCVVGAQAWGDWGLKRERCENQSVWYKYKLQLMDTNKPSLYKSLKQLALYGI